MNPDKLYLTQTDTTVGFLSSNSKKLSIAKDREASQPFLICLDSLKKLKKLTRAPRAHKKRIRRTSQTSFLYSNKKAIRVVSDHHHSQLLKEFDFLYSTSANKNRECFDLKYAYTQADIIIEEKSGLYEGKASNIFKLGKKRVQKLR